MKISVGYSLFCLSAMLAAAQGRIIDEIGQLLNGDGDLRKLIEQSLRSAFNISQLSLDVSRMPLSWPISANQYLNYLVEYEMYIPDEPGTIMINEDKDPEQHTESITRRMHFYYLISHSNDTGAFPMDHPEFKSLINQYADSHYDYLDDSQSFNNVQLAYYKTIPSYDVASSLVRGKPNAPRGWQTFNQFVARDLNPGLRTITLYNDNSVATAAADMMYHEMRHIAADSTFVEGAISVMGTHSYADVQSLLGAGSAYANSFANGTVLRFAVPPAYCHRIHSPIDGTLVETRDMITEDFWDVDVGNDTWTLLKPRLDSEGFRFRQHRGVLTVDSSTSAYGDVGLIAVVPIGIGHSESVRITVSNGTAVRKGDDLGYMVAGSSALLIFFQEKAGMTSHYNTTHVKKLMGTSIASLTTAGSV